MKEKTQRIQRDFFRPLAFIPNPLSFPKNSTEFFGLIFLLVFMFLAGPPPAAGGAADRLSVKKRSLEEIKQQLDEKKKELEKYKEEEDRINKEIAGLKKQEKRNVTRRKELEARLTRSKAKSAESRQKSDSLSKAYKDIQNNIYGETVVYSLAKHFCYPYYGLKDLSKSLLLKSAIFKKHSLINKIKGETARVKGDIQVLTRQNVELKAKKKLLDTQRSARRKLVKRKRTELEKTKEKQARLSREVENLQNAALGLTKLVKKLEKKSPYKLAARSKELPIGRHSLPWPAQGKVISRYGREEVPLLKTWIVREGIRIRTEGPAPVFPVLKGKVIYAGPFRTYGKVVIVDHERGFFTIYGLLRDISVAKNDRVTTGSTLGRSGSDTQAVSGAKVSDYSAVYFEIRLGAEAVDPLIWLTNAVKQ
ncbi:MAG: peptidoglycan DD-metalloendopeptidase family protein [Elusimicrobia bacterium]|nr:peptidoglycan DD-metalloendopeptidase family protein [Elusimicrobiota bacterium]